MGEIQSHGSSSHVDFIVHLIVRRERCAELEELQQKLANEQFKTKNIKGLEFNPIFNRWKESENLSVNYIISSLKI